MYIFENKKKFKKNYTLFLRKGSFKQKIFISPADPDFRINISFVIETIFLII